MTELVARPLIALDFPELSGLVQPLAGEWAVRRSLFERLHVPTGYAVELAALVDTAGLLDVDAIAQVDLGRRAHRHQALRDLGAMATQIVAAAQLRRGGRDPLDHRDVVLRQYHPVGAGIGPVDRVVAVGERPPAVGFSVMTLKLGRHEFADDATLMMAIVNRTPDSFYDKGATWAEDKAFERVAAVVAQGAEIVDIGGIKAAPGVEIDAEEEKGRVVDFVARVRDELPDARDLRRHLARRRWARRSARPAPTSSTTRGAGPTRSWSTWPPRHDAAIICTHTGGVTPRTRPFRIEYDDVVAAAIADTVAYASRALAAGVARESIVIDPAHDFGKNTFHSLELTRRLGEMVDTGWPVLVSLSNKDFVGETLDLPVGERLTGTLAATAVCALAGARIYRVHEVVETRQVVDMVWTIAGRRPPARAIRGLQ